MIYLVFVSVKKLGFEKFTGLESPSEYKNIQAVFIPLVFIIMGIFTNWNAYYNAEIHKFLLFGLYVLVVGVVEEFAFRGAVFPLCIKALKSSKRPILMGALLSSSFFGVIHFVTLFTQPDNLIGTTSQVFFALSIGVFLVG